MNALIIETVATISPSAPFCKGKNSVLEHVDLFLMLKLVFVNHTTVEATE